MTIDSLLEVSDLRTVLTASSSRTHVLEGVSLTVAPGESLGVIGESGSGKSVLARAIIGLDPMGVTTEAAGSIRFGGQEVLGTPPRQRRGAAARMSMIFQDPSLTLNPVVRVGRQILEGAEQLRGRSRGARREHLHAMLSAVGLDDVRRIARSYPSQLSGGQRQRVGIAAALASEPHLLVADEPTTALDVSMQRTVLDLIDRLRAERGMSLIHITHDLGVLTDRTDRITVMYAGRVVETGPTQQLLTEPRHPYTRALLDITPKLSSPVPLPLPTIAGTLPDMAAPRTGCPLAARCRFATAACSTDRPVTATVATGHEIACWHPLGASDTLRSAA